MILLSPPQTALGFQVHEAMSGSGFELRPLACSASTLPAEPSTQPYSIILLLHSTILIQHSLRLPCVSVVRIGPIWSSGRYPYFAEGEIKTQRDTTKVTGKWGENPDLKGGYTSPRLSPASLDLCPPLEDVPPAFE